mgnify:FL=1|tara:strand:- start:67 stop:501 length:435 start_codon:yes stop_codon:yes gene_type:complete
MKDPSHFVRKAVYDSLNGNVTLNSANVPVYNVVPSSATTPYILITSLQNDIVENIKDTFLMQVQTQVDIVTAFDTNTGGQLDVNLAMNQITNLLVSRNSFFDLSANNFKCVSSQNNGIAYITDDTDTETIFRGVLTLINDVEQL